MRVELPSGAYVEVEERWKGSLQGRVKGAVMIESADGKVFIPGDIGDRQTDAFLKEQITEWSFPGIPIPKAHGNKGAEVIGEILDGDDYTALHEAVQPLVVKVVGGNRGNSRSTPAELPSSSPS